MHSAKEIILSMPTLTCSKCHYSFIWNIARRGDKVEACPTCWSAYSTVNYIWCPVDEGTFKPVEPDDHARV